MIQIVGKCQRIARREVQWKPLNFPYALKSFIGYLEGTDKSGHTVKNYRLDLLSFQKFLETAQGGRALPLGQLTATHLGYYHSFLKNQGLRANTRRRKLLTVRRFLSYLNRRKKIPLDIGKQVPTPHKIERVPQTVPSLELIDIFNRLPHSTEIDARNRALLLTLAETGCLVSECTLLRFENWLPAGLDSAAVHIEGKARRTVPVSISLYQAIQELKMLQKTNLKGRLNRTIFLGFNKFGSLGTPITSRGVELLVKSYARRYPMPSFTPRTLRHSAAIRWFQEGVPREEIQRRLGLKTSYAFRSYEPIFKSKT